MTIRTIMLTLTTTDKTKTISTNSLARCKWWKRKMYLCMNMFVFICYCWNKACENEHLHFACVSYYLKTLKAQINDMTLPA